MIQHKINTLNPLIMIPVLFLQDWKGFKKGEFARFSNQDAHELIVKGIVRQLHE